MCCASGLRPAASNTASPVRDLAAEDADDPTKAWCLPCSVNLHDDCLWASRPTSCDCDCPWLVAEMAQHFPSLRENP
jgi:hypothetical protein